MVCLQKSRKAHRRFAKGLAGKYAGKPINGSYHQISRENTKKFGIRGVRVLKWAAGHRRKMKVSVLLLIAYIVISAGLFVSGGREVTRGVYKLWVPCTIPSKPLRTEADYCQGFYTPSDVTGIELYFVIPETGDYADMILRVYEWSSGEMVGESEITMEQITNDGIATVIFEDFVLREGTPYAFEVSTVSGEGNTTQIWMGETQQGYGMNVCYQGAELSGTSLVYNLLYDYDDGHFIGWMFLTAAFLAVMALLV